MRYKNGKGTTVRNTGTIIRIPKWAQKTRARQNQGPKWVREQRELARLVTERNRTIAEHYKAEYELRKNQANREPEDPDTEIATESESK
jgi:type II restriction/modification system DNA methylase subunit YeeA